MNCSYIFKIPCVILCFLILIQTGLAAQSPNDTHYPEISKVFGYRGVVFQNALGINRDNITFFDKWDFYSIGFPVKITRATPGKIKLELEVVPVLKPYLNSCLLNKVLLSLHPGLYHLRGEEYIGFGSAFESDECQVGFTSWLIKDFKCGNKTDSFIELVAPA